MQDDQIIELYIDRDEQAIIETESKYGCYCMDLAFRILNDREDAREAVNDTWLRTWSTIPPKRPEVLRLYLAKITRNLSLSMYRSRTAQKRGGTEVALALEELGDCVGKDNDPLDNVMKNELSAAVQAFVESLPSRDRAIFIRRYFYMESIPQIACRYCLKESNVLMILCRVRKKLKCYLSKEGFDL